MVFAPGRDIAGAYNLWRGFACEAIPGRNHQPFLDHILQNVCSGDEDHFRYLERWMAQAVQNPAMAGQVAVVLRGGQGTGKGTFAQGFGSLWGRHYLQISSAKHLVGNFNAHLRDCVTLFADEAFFAGDKQHESVLRTLITEKTIVLEPKGVDAEIGPNFIHLIMSSNSSWVIPAGYDERRFFVIDVSDARKQDLDYFQRIEHMLMREGGRESLLHHLLTLDISDFQVRRAPQTAALAEQKLYTLSAEEQWWLERLMDGRLTAASNGWVGSIMKDRLHADYLLYAEKQRIMRRLSPTAVGQFLAKVLPPGFPRAIQRTTEVERQDAAGRLETIRERAYWYDVPDLETCRDTWSRRYGSGFVWPVDGGEDVADLEDAPF
jgi:hypothetical protein